MVIESLEAYQNSKLIEELETSLSQMAPDRKKLSAKELFSIDQFHVGGPTPITRLLDRVHWTETETIIDLGSGFGGVSRLIANTTKATVIGVDRTSEYVDAAHLLNEYCDLSGVSFVEGDVRNLNIDDNSIDGAILVHVQINIEDKIGLFKEISRVLKPGAAFLIWEIVSNNPGQLQWPLPWSLDGSESHLVSETQLRETIVSGGFNLIHWENRSDWAKSWVQQISQPDAPRSQLPGLLDQGHVRVKNLGQAIMTDRVQVVEGIFHV